MKVSHVAAGAGAAIGLGWAGYAARTWSRYGKVPPTDQRATLLDRYMPEYEVREVHQAPVAAPAELAWQAACELSLTRSPIARAIFRAREVILGGRRGEPAGRAFMEEALSLGWRILSGIPGREMVFGAVTQPWKADVRFRGLPPEEFLGFAEPGYVKIAWAISVEPDRPDRSVFRTETRAIATDPESRERFRRYWAIFSPGILLIRREMVRGVQAEGRRLAGAARAQNALKPGLP